MSAVESILTLDRLRQNVAIKELEQQLIGLQKQNSSTSMRKTCSVPNFSQVSLDLSLPLKVYRPFNILQLVVFVLQNSGVTKYFFDYNFIFKDFLI